MYIRPLWSCGGEWAIKWKWYHALIRKDLPTNQPESVVLSELWLNVISLLFFCFFCPYLSAITSKKKALDTEKPEKRKIGIFARRWGKETDIGEGMGGELRVREKKYTTVHYKNIFYLHLIQTRNTVNLYITRKSFTRIEKEKSIWKQEVS